MALWIPQARLELGLIRSEGTSQVIRVQRRGSSEADHTDRLCGWVAVKNSVILHTPGSSKGDLRSTVQYTAPRTQTSNQIAIVLQICGACKRCALQGVQNRLGGPISPSHGDGTVINISSLLYRQPGLQRARQRPWRPRVCRVALSPNIDS